MAFVQTLAFEAADEQAVRSLMDDWDRESSKAAIGLQRYLLLKDHDRPNAYLLVVEFSSYEEAMRNSARPETDAFARRLADLVQGHVEYRNLDTVAR